MNILHFERNPGPSVAPNDFLRRLFCVFLILPLYLMLFWVAPEVGVRDSHAPEYVWLENLAKVPSTWKALMDDKETLPVSSERATMLKQVLVFDVILWVPTNNAPHTPHGDIEKAAWDRQVRNLMRVFAMAHLQEKTPEVLTALELEAPSNEKLLDTAFVLLASLLFSIKRSRKLTVNRSLDMSSKSTPRLFSKEEVHLLQQRQSLLKHVERSSLHRSHPYRRDAVREYGKGKG